MKTMQNKDELPGDVKKRVEKWLQGNYDAKTKAEIRAMMEENPHALIDAFYTTLTFGTAGLRGIMGPGSNRMNEYTVRAATQGLANYLLKVYGKNGDIAVAIGHDSRINSREFAESSARVLAGSNIKVYLFETLRPTPLVSFACRYKKCQAAIMITASHNPPEYNGYKVYWNDGGQVLPPHDVGIIQEVEKIKELSQIHEDSLSSPLIQPIGKDVDDAYLHAIETLELYPKESKEYGNELKILYSNLHGTGITMVPQALERFGFTNLGFVEEQKEPDGRFPTTNSPNPEEDQAVAIGVKKLLNEKYDILIATDPDCDRIGVIVRHHDKAHHLTGNQFAVIAVDAICKRFKDDKKAAYIKSIVTTDLFKKIVEKHSGASFDVLPGFKYIAEMIRGFETKEDGYHYVFGGEESCGFLLGTYTRDKDAVTASCLISEIALQAKRKGKTLVDLLDDVYREYGYSSDISFSLKFDEGKEGRDQLVKIMENLRKVPPKDVAGHLVTECVDLKKPNTLSLPPADVLILRLDDGSKVIIRPSGTEPKIKVYLMLNEPMGMSLDDAKARGKSRGKAFEAVLKQLVHK